LKYYNALKNPRLPKPKPKPKIIKPIVNPNKNYESFIS